MSAADRRKARVAAARARGPVLLTSRVPPVAPVTVGTNPALRLSAAPMPYGFTGTRRHGNKRSSKGGSGTGGVNSIWRTNAPSYKSPGLTTHDRGYDQTVGNTNV